MRHFIVALLITLISFPAAGSMEIPLNEAYGEVTYLALGFDCAIRKRNPALAYEWSKLLNRRIEIARTEGKDADYNALNSLVHNLIEGFELNDISCFDVPKSPFDKNERYR